MRLPARRIAASALCAGLVLGVTAPVAMAADGGTVRERATSQAPLPDTGELRDQAKDLGLIGSVLSPVADLIEAVIGSDGGRLSQTQADQHAQAVREALAQANASGTAAKPNANSPARPPAATTPNGTAQGADAPTTLPARSDAPAADLAARATSGLQKQVDALIRASVAGDTEQVRPAADKVVTSAVNVIAATLAAGRLPAPDLAGLPQASRD
ncbi:hypothetical protein AB0E75_02215 [Streptomyces griseoviridis]|uniref:Secreted protein n=1 Tax=Streptomyces griseoviridis TaxID=45398 RepID=A0A918G4N0_STRGD|nr:hypothetical protein [Streptomyces niveoruber]GGS17891.1 hypothetical protein GCM10010238_02480 [Streptomyces niveoruber]